MRKEEVHSFLLNLMKRIEYSRESKDNKINKILFLTIYYNIFESKYNEVVKDNGEDEEQLKIFIDSFLEEEDKNVEELMKEDEFKKIEENNILKYKEAKESIENIKKDKYKDKEKKKEDEENKIETDKFRKVEENNILKYKEAKAEVESIKDNNIKVENEIDVKKQNNDSQPKYEFEKLEEKNISNYKQVKDEIKKIQEEKLELKNVEKTKDRKVEENDFHETESSKIEEKNIFTYKEAKIIIEDIKKNIEDDKEELNIIEQEEADEFKKVEEKNIFNYTEAKSEFHNIKDEQFNMKNEINEEKVKEDNLVLKEYENKFHKIEEKNINDNIVARKEIEEITKKNEELKKKYKLEGNEYQQIINNVKAIRETKCDIKTMKSKENTNLYGKINNQSDPFKIKAAVKIANAVINEMLYGKVKFSKPIIKIIDTRGYVTFKNINLVKNSYEPNCKESILMYDGTVRVDLQYLEYTKIHCKNINAVPKYYLMYIPFSGTKSIVIDDEEFLNEKLINDKISFDMKSSEFAYDTVLKEERCIGPYVKLYKECEVYIILECVINILMKKIIETI